MVPAAEYDADGHPITCVCLLPAGHDGQGKPAGGNIQAEHGGQLDGPGPAEDHG